MNRIAQHRAHQNSSSNDTCSNAVVPGAGMCTVDLRFRPNDFGPRAATLTLRDTVTSQALNLALSGTGIVIAAPGQSCVNAECATGSTCTGGTCCDRECVSSCQACSALRQRVRPGAVLQRCGLLGSPV